VSPQAVHGVASPSGASVFTILLVCTGNVCRSAFAQQLGRAYLHEVYGAEAGMRLISAGTKAVVDSGMHLDTALVLRGLGGGPDGFRAQQLRAELIGEADLVLVMTRKHRDAVLGLAPRALARTFLLREAPMLLEQAAAELPAGDPVGRARACVAAMAVARGRRAVGRADDIPDPIGRPLEVHQDVGEAISEALLPVLAHVAALLAPETTQRPPT
jgi:protein-tyrosine-phosphatase